MKKWNLSGVFVLLLLLSPGSLEAQTSSNRAPSAPITYPGDTEASIARRMKWVEEAKREAELVWWGSLNPNEAKQIIDAFNKVYPFIRVAYWRGTGEEAAAKLEAEYTGGRHSVDVIWGGEPNNYPRWAKLGVIIPFTDIIPGIGVYDRRMYGKRGDWIIPAFAPKTPQYNTRLVSAAELPRNWEDLLHLKWKGQLGGVVEADDWAVLALAEGGWGIEKTEAFLTKIREQKPRMIQGNSAVHSLLLAGEFKITIMGLLRHVLVSQKKNAPVDWIRVNPILVTGSAFIMPNKGPHPNAARLFLEWQLSAPGLSVWSEITQMYATGIANPISQLLHGMPLVVRTEEVLQKIAELDLGTKFRALLFGM